MLQRETDLNFKSNCRWIDVHCHLDMLSITPDEALERAQKVGIERIITIGTSPDDHEQVFSLSQKLGAGGREGSGFGRIDRKTLLDN